MDEIMVGLESCAQNEPPTEEWRFIYDGDGARVMEEYFLNGASTHYRYFFAGGSYEVQVDALATTTKEYYSIGGMMVALNTTVDDGTPESTLTYMASDHLTSASIVMDDTGTLLSEQRYMPFGEVRLDVGDTITETDLGYTGQRNYGDFGLMDYHARFYSPKLGRFVQPDTIVPEIDNPFAWDRYAYNINNPIRYTDPTGHGYCSTDHADPQLCEGKILKENPEENLGPIGKKQLVCKDYRNFVLRAKLLYFTPPTKIERDERVYFDKLSPDEKKLIDENKNVSYLGMFDLANEAQGTSRELFGKVSINNPRDVFRHAYWTASMTQKYGEDFARDFSTVHESAYQWNESHPGESFMDLHNNEVGIQIGLDNPDATPGELKSLVRNALWAGELVVWDGYDIYTSDTCPACVFE